MKKNKDNFSKKIFFGILIIGTILRIGVGFRGYNFDIKSYFIVNEIISKGGNVYSQTTRYNYGPIWCYLVFSINSIFFYIFRFIHYKISGLSQLIFSVRFILISVDILIYTFIYKKTSKIAALLFFLNPISIIVTGYHSQFDNLAILFGLFSSLMLDKNKKKNNKYKLIGLILLGISLSIKHILFIFPIWLFIKEKRLINKIYSIAIPYGIFFVSFAPFMRQGMNGIIKNVFIYTSYYFSPFWNNFVPSFVKGFYIGALKYVCILFLYILKLFSPTIGSLLIRILPRIIENSLARFLLFASILVWLGYKLERKNYKAIFTYYLGGLFAFTPAMANQYFVIPLIFISIYRNVFFYIFTLLCFIFLLVNNQGMHFLKTDFILLSIFNSRDSMYNLIGSIFILGYLFVLFKRLNKKGYLLLTETMNSFFNRRIFKKTEI